jgi:hypothetical protein
MLSKNINYFKSKPVNIPKITILLDNGYHPEHLTIELQKIYPQIKFSGMVTTRHSYYAISNWDFLANLETEEA